MKNLKFCLFFIGNERLSDKDDSNKYSNIGLGEEIGILEIKICNLSAALKVGVQNPLFIVHLHEHDPFWAAFKFYKYGNCVRKL